MRLEADLLPDREDRYKVEPPIIAVGDGGRGQLPPQISGKIFLGRNHVKFGHFSIFHAYVFGQICLAPPKLTELLRLWNRPL